jgi:hypothetical protein
MSAGFNARDAEPTMTMSVYPRYTFTESLCKAGTAFKLGVVDLDALRPESLASPLGDKLKGTAQTVSTM